MVKKGLRFEFLDQKYLFMQNFFLPELGGTPPPPTEKIHLIVFCGFHKRLIQSWEKMNAIDAQVNNWGGAEGQLVQKCWNM